MFEFANKHGYTITELLPDENRIYCKWERGTEHMCHSGITEPKFMYGEK